MSDTDLSLRSAIAAPEPSEAEAAKRKRILLVEGDGFTRLVLLLRLRLAGFGVDFTSNGMLGLGKLRSCHPDILLVELKLYGMSGLDLVRSARKEPAFGNRPIYVFTNASRLNKTTRRELEALNVQLFDKTTTTREQLVQIFSRTFFNRELSEEQMASARESEARGAALSKTALSGALQELIAGVSEQSEIFVNENVPRKTSGPELVSRVSSLESCARAAGLPDLARQAKALEDFLKELSHNEPSCTARALNTVKEAVKVMQAMPLDSGRKDKEPKRFGVVYVDEAANSNRAIEKALAAAVFEPVCFQVPAKAREFLSSNRTDLVLTNVALPEAHGLTVADIRQMPKHRTTPVVYGPESNGTVSSDEDLPVSAPRLDKSRVLLTELVVRALNAVQGGTGDASAPPTPGRAPARSSETPSPATLPSQPFEDSVELFAKAPGGRPVSATRPALQSEPEIAVGAQRHQSLEPLFASSDIPEQLFMRAEPDSPAEDQHVQLPTSLRVTPVDESQVDERPLEAFPPSDSPGPAPTPTELQPAFEEQSTEIPWMAEANEELGQTAAAHEPVSADQPGDTFTDENLTAATTNYGDAMKNQIPATSADYLEMRGSQQSGNGSGQQLAPHENLDAFYPTQDELEQGEPLAHHYQASSPAGAPEEGLVPEMATEQNAQARCAELEQEVAALRQAIEGLNGGFSELNHASPDHGNRLAELEQALSQKTAELEEHKSERQLAEADLRQQLDRANLADQQNDAARKAAEARCAQLEKELSSLKQAREEELKRPSAGKGGEDSGLTPSELEQQVRQGVTALARATAELAIERGERQRNQQRAAELSGRLQALHQDLSRTLESQRQDLARISSLEEQHRQAAQALERSTADAEQHRAEYRLMEEQLQKAKEANAQLRKDLSFFEETNKDVDGSRQQLQERLETSLKTARETETRLQQETAERQKLAESLEEAQRELQNQARRYDALNQELQSTRETLQDREAKLQKNAADRQRESAYDPARQQRDNPERDLEFSKIRSALQLEQVERKKQESELARTRQNALEAAQAARALRTSLRRQIREPVENLVHSARNLLELEMSEEQKKLAESVLQDVLLVQTRLREPGISHEESSDTTLTSSSKSGV